MIFSLYAEIQLHKIWFSFLQESLDNPNGAAGGDIINCENAKDGNGRNSGDPLVIDIGKCSRTNTWPSDSYVLVVRVKYI